MMTTKEMGDALVAACRAGQEADLLNQHYAPNAVSIEALPNPQTGSAVTQGLDGIRAKHAWWDENFVVHDASVDGPFPHGDDRFGVIFEMDAEDKNSGQRHKMKEIAVYTVSAGKIVKEEFFYNM